MRSYPSTLRDKIIIIQKGDIRTIAQPGFLKADGAELAILFI